MTEDHTGWCRDIFKRLENPPHLWNVPRSGLLFRREGDILVLVNMIPWHPGMGCPEQIFKEYQNVEYLDTRQNFKAAGIKVRKRLSKTPIAPVILEMKVRI